MTQPALGPRVLARFLDGALVAIVATAIVAGLGVNRTLVAVVLALGYESVALATWGKTVGKHVVRITVVDERARGGLRPEQAVVRALTLLVPLQLLGTKIDTVAEWAVLAVVLANGFTVASRREDRRGLHDLAAGTRPVAPV